MSEKNQYIDPQELSVFLEIAKNKSFSQTAQRLGVTTSAVSQSITHLEHCLGVVLFDRSRRPIDLTREGKRLAVTGEPLLREMKRVAAVVKPAEGFYSELKLGLSESVSGTLSPWLLKQIRSVVSDITVFTGFTGSLAKSFLDGGIDILISGRTFPNEANIWRKPIYTEKYVLIYPKSWGKAVEDEDTVRTLIRTMPMITYNEQSDDRNLINRFFRSKGISMIKGPRVESSYAMEGLVSEGKGWSIMAPANILIGEQFISNVRISSVLDIHLERTQKVLVRDEGFQPLAEKICQWSREICLSELKPRLRHFSASLDESVRLSSD